MNSWLAGIFSLARGLLDSVLPPRCFSCGEMVITQGDMCSHCWRGMDFISKPQCNRCGFPFEFAEESIDNDTADQLCGVCIESQPLFEKSRAVFRYDDASKRLILALKYFDKLEGADHFGRLMWRTIKPFASEGDVIMPVPLHRKRLFQRRFNQSALLAQAIGRQAGLAVDMFSLLRTKATISQGGLSRKQRAENVRGAFAIEEKIKAELKGKSVILVDDVFTTGATSSECVRILLKHGVRSVVVISLARVVNS